MQKSSVICVASCLLFSLTDCNCNDQLGSALGEIELALCDRGEACGCSVLPPADSIIDFGTPPGGGSTRRILRIENANQPRKLIVQSIALTTDEDAFAIGLIQIHASASPDAEVRSWDSSQGRLILEESAWAEVLIDFLPPSAGQYEGTLTIKSNSSALPTREVHLLGGEGSSTTCVPAGECGDGTMLDFGTYSDSEVGLDYEDVLGRPLALGTESLAITNTGASEMLVTIELTDDGIVESLPGELVGANGVFFVGEVGCAVIGAGETLSVPIEYRPSTAGEHHGEVVVAGLGAPVHIPLTGRVIGPHICFRTEDEQPDDALLQFGEAPAYRTPQNISESRRIWASNCGFEADLAINEVELAAQSSSHYDSTSLPWTAISLSPGEEVEVPVTVSPNSATIVGSSLSGRLLFQTNDTLRPMTAVDLITLVGQPEQCTLIASPSPVDFGWVATDEAGVGDECPIPIPMCEELISRVRSVTFNNVGHRACNDITLAGLLTDPNSTDMFQYYPSNTPPTTFSLQPGETFGPIELLFKRPPSEQQSNHFAKLPYAHADSTGVTDLVLQAVGGGSPTCNVVFQPVSPPSLFCPTESLAFGNVNIGQEKTIDLRVINTGSQDCNVTRVGFSPMTSGVFSYSSATLPGVIAVNDVAIVSVTFLPTPPSGNNPFEEIPFLCGINALEVQVNSGDNGAFQTETVSLAGKGTRPDIDVIPGELDFGLVTVGCCSDWKRVAIYNSGDGDLTINSIGVLATSDPGFETTQAGITVLTPNSSTEFEARFCAENVGQFSGVVEIQSTDDNEEFFTVPMRAEGTLDSHGLDEFQQPERPKVDVLWSIDDSGSMSEEQQNLAGNFSAFIDTATSLDTDYHVGVVTTDSESDQAGHLYACSGNPLWISDSQPVGQQRDQFSCNVRVTDSGRPSSDNKESPLQAARLALDYPNIDGHNVGFYRDDAKLYVILVTDEEDQSDGSAQLYVDYFRNLKGQGNTDLLNISAIAGPPPNGCDTAEGNQKDYDAVNSVGGQFRSICSADWTDLISDLGLDVFNSRRQFPLSRPATPTTITVQICDDDGAGNAINCRTIAMDSQNGWSFDAATNSITFNGTSIPGAGQHVVIEYEAICFSE